jgi:hypothetical protein
MQCDIREPHTDAMGRIKNSQEEVAMRGFLKLVTIGVTLLCANPPLVLAQSHYPALAIEPLENPDDSITPQPFKDGPKYAAVAVADRRGPNRFLWRC